MEINRYDISDILGMLPKLEPLSMREQVNLLICTLGFEDRTHGIVDKLSIQGQILGKKKILLIEYPTNESDNQKNIHFFEVAAERAGAELIKLKYSRKDFTQKLIDNLSRLLQSDDPQVTFDISTCSSYVFYPLMKVLYDLAINLRLVYSEAQIYYPTLEEWSEVNKRAESENTLYVESFENANFQSSGVDDIYAYNIFSEMNPGNKPCVLIAVPNFSCTRMNAIIAKDNELNKTKYEDIVWLIGKPPASGNEWRIEAVIKTNNLLNKPKTKIKHVSTLDYYEMIKELELIWTDLKYTNHLTIGSLGSKNQHVGTFIFTALHRDVGLWLTEPKEFQARRFSEGIGDCWQINFRSTVKLKDSLGKYLSFRWKLI